MTERVDELAAPRICSESSHVARASRLVSLGFLGVFACSAVDTSERPLQASAQSLSSIEGTPQLRSSGVPRGNGSVAGDTSGNVEPPWFSALLSASDRVVRGRVRATQGYAPGPSAEPGIFTRVELDIEDAADGQAAGVLDFWLEGGTLERRARRLSLGARFRLGEVVVVFLRERDGHRRLVHMGLGKWSPSLNPDRFAPSPEALAHIASGSNARPPSLPWEEIVSAVGARKLRQ
jgi:hypothetical protein